MPDTLLPLNLPPGFAQNGTRYQAINRWYSGNLVRFFSGTIQPVGGWQRPVDDTGAELAALSGRPRDMIAWRLADGSVALAFGTTEELALLLGGSMHDITPSGFTNGQENTEFSSGTSNGQYGAGTYGSGQYGTGSLAGAKTEADTWSVSAFGEYLAAVCTSDKRLVVWTGDAGTAAYVLGGTRPTTGATPSTSGGALADNSYYYVVTATLPILGEILVAKEIEAAVSGGAGAGSVALTWPAWPGATGYKVYRGTSAGGESEYYDSATNSFTDIGGAVDGSAVPPTTVPESCSGVVSTPEHFLVLLRAEDNVRKVAWASQESVTDWFPTAENSAGSYTLTTNGRLMAAAPTPRLTLLWTDRDVWSMMYIGGTLIYSFSKIGDECGVIGPHAAVAVNSEAYWMGKNNFFSYNGFVSPLPCDVRDAVFSNFNSTQANKVFAVPNSLFGEIWWFYPSAQSMENDRYVVYNYREQHWVTGALSRAAGVDGSTTDHPVWLDPDGVIWEHESGDSRDATAYIQSGPVEYPENGSGNRLMQVQRLIPDEKTLGDVEFSVYGAMLPTDTETRYGPFAPGAPVDVRITARQLRFEWTEQRSSSWRIGTMRLGLIPVGTR